MLVSLENGGKVASYPTPVVAPVNLTPTRTTSAPAAAPQASPVPVLRQTSLPSATSPAAKAEPTPAPMASPFTTEPAVVTRSQSSDGSVSARNFCSPNDMDHEQTQTTAALHEENARLTGELRAAREKIRNLELQVEGMKANAQRAAQAAQAVLES
jgi:coronin-1B/1C/6